MAEEYGKALLVPCSGMGKVHGLISREAVFAAVDQLPEGMASTMCLAMLVMGDETALEAVRTRPVFTVDGCPKLCAHKNIELAGGRLAQAVRVVDAFKEHRGVDAGTATSLTDGGWQIAGEIGQSLASAVSRIVTEGDK